MQADKDRLDRLARQDLKVILEGLVILEVQDSKDLVVNLEFLEVRELVVLVVIQASLA